MDVGKSSLLNTLLNRDRALVSNIPGTTRDSLEELLDIQGILFRVVDTAGIRAGKDVLEKLSIKKTKQHIHEGQLFVCVLDGARALTKDDAAIFKQIPLDKTIFVINKNDLDMRLDISALEALVPKASVISVSTVTRKGIAAFEKRLVKQVWCGSIGDDSILVTQQRQYDILCKVKESLRHAADACAEKRSLEFLAFDIREALDLLGEIVGVVCTDDVLSAVFSKFCIGK